MLKYKTIALPPASVTVPKKDMYSQQAADLAVAPVAQIIQAESIGGWTLHSYMVVPAVIFRKLTIYDFVCRFLGWIPVVGGILKKLQAPFNDEQDYIVATFVKES